MNESPSRPVLAALIRVAADATGAGHGRLVMAGPDEESFVLALAGPDPGLTATGMAAYVMATGQPQVLTHRSDQAPAPTATRSALCVPCICDGEVVGALELMDKSGGGPFSIDDLELACLLGGIAGVALTTRPNHVDHVPPPDPTRLVEDLERLAALDPAGYRALAQVLQGLLDV